jgi:cyclopropane fatty-acyl-phospholipid synthase-like methyltransferase
MNNRPFSPATERNSRSVLAILRRELADASSILEIGSGTGQHAVLFAAEMPHLVWQTSDVKENLAGIRAWLEDTELPNALAPLELDVLINDSLAQMYDGVFSANTAHIMSQGAVEKMFALAGNVLDVGGVFVLYGPFRQNGEFNTVSNADFHRSLRQRDAAMGIRHIEALDDLAARGQLERVRYYAMPANNQIAVWRKEGLDDGNA